MFKLACHKLPATDQTKMQNHKLTTLKYKEHTQNTVQHSLANDQSIQHTNYCEVYTEIYSSLHPVTVHRPINTAHSRQ
jgi:hypothetical protein